MGELVTLKASVNYTGRTSMVVGLRVESENIQTGEIKHCNSSYFTMVAKDKNGKNVQVPGIIIDSEQAVRRFARSVARQLQSKIRSSKFNSSEFKIEEHLDVLKGQNVKIEL